MRLKNRLFGRFIEVGGRNRFWERGVSEPLERVDMQDPTDRITDATMQLDQSPVAEVMRDVTISGRKRPSLLILGGLDVGNLYVLENQITRVGRDATCDLVLRDDGISRQHVEVRRMSGDRLLVKDMNSTNGIFVDGEQVAQAIIHPGDKVLLGRRTILKYELQDALEQSYQKQIYDSTTKDGLTGIFNRKHFSHRITSDLSFSRRHKIPCSVLMIDIDHFKQVNDTWGHRTGDQVLIAIVAAIKSTVRTEDMLARYGGEEFVVVAPGTHFEGGRALAERIRSRIEQERVTSLDDSRTTFMITASIGVATVPPGVVTTPEAVVTVADKNLYVAKESGRNRVVASEMV